MKKRWMALLGAVILTVSSASMVYAEEATESDYQWDFVYNTDGTKDIRKTECDEQGTVETLEYETPAYAVNEVLGMDETITKKLHVYLPYGYDESQQYNVLYLMHGGGETEDFWLIEQERCHGAADCNVLDNMIKDGLCDPLIVVTPTFYSEVDGVEITAEDAVAYAETIGEDNYTRGEDLYTWFFQYELRNEIVPLIESTYSTYAAGDTSEENLIATRDHRAYAGLSMGSITSVHSVLMGNTDIISYVGSYSGSKTNFDLFKETMESKYADYDINFWFNGEGVNDIAYEEHMQFYADATTQMSDKFVDGENCAMVVQENGSHDWLSWVTDLYNTLLVFFK